MNISMTISIFFRQIFRLYWLAACRRCCLPVATFIESRDFNVKRLKQNLL